MYAEAVGVIGKASCKDCEKATGSDVASPNMIYTNTAKYLYMALCRATHLVSHRL